MQEARTASASRDSEEAISGVWSVAHVPANDVIEPVAARWIRKVARRSIQVGAFLLDRFPSVSHADMQVFRPDVGALRDSNVASVLNVGDGRTWTNTRPCMESFEGRLASGEWESGRGRHDIKFDFDEWVYVLEGHAEITIKGVTRTLRAGDCALFRAGIAMSWNVPRYIRKVWVHRYSPPNPIERALLTVLRSFTPQNNA